METSRAYQGKYFSILGDSISTFQGYSTPVEAAFYDTAKKLESKVTTLVDTWWGRVIDSLGGKLLANDSRSGSTVCKHWSCEVESYGCSDERTSALGTSERSPDVILVFMGMNDWGFGFCVQGKKGETDKPNYECFADAYNAMIKKLRKNYPQADVWCLTLPYGSRLGEQETEFALQKRKVNVTEYCKAIRSCAEKNGCRIIDLYAKRGYYDTIDGAHPDLDGMQTIAAWVLSDL